MKKRKRTGALKAEEEEETRQETQARRTMPEKLQTWEGREIYPLRKVIELFTRFAFRLRASSALG